MPRSNFVRITLLREVFYVWCLWSIYEKQKKNSEFKKKEDTRCIYRNELGRAYFQYDMTYGDFKDLQRIIASDKLLIDKTFEIASNTYYDDYHHGLATTLYKFLDKKTRDANIHIGAGIISKDQQLANELHKPSLEHFRSTKDTHLIDIIFVLLILQTCS